MVYINKFFFFLSLIRLISCDQKPNGKYCGLIYNNLININFNDKLNVANITANIFGKEYECDDENYTFNQENLSIMMPEQSDDCLNIILQKYNLCPCPPEMKYDNIENIVNIVNKEMGIIQLDSC